MGEKGIGFWQKEGVKAERGGWARDREVETKGLGLWQRKGAETDRRGWEQRR